MRQGHRACAAAISFAACIGFSSFAAAAVPQVPSLPTATAGYVNYAVTNVPSYYKTIANNTPANNAISDAGATLGRVLFYDKRLSHDNGGSCSSCHKQANAFSDPNKLSLGINNQPTTRHSMGLANVEFYANGKMFWDERAASLEAQALVPIQSATEMGSTLSEVVTKLSATTFYPTLFNAAFGTPDITSDRIGKAIAQFERSMVSYKSKFDQQLQGGNVFLANELRGEQVFNGPGRCSGCHAANNNAARVLDRTHNIGLDLVTIDAGAGNGLFKAPSLRNVAKREHFMHDGRFSTLEQVVQFYNTGIQNNINLDPGLKNPQTQQAITLGLNGQQVSDLLAYLDTFTDEAFLISSLFSDPFVTLPGDYDGDGVVTSSDYVVWRKSVGDTTLLVADGNGDHKVDGADYDIWSQNVGKTWQSLAYGASGGLSNTSVPEPTGVTLAMIAVICGLNSRRRVRRASCRSAGNNALQRASSRTR